MPRTNIPHKLECITAQISQHLLEIINFAIFDYVPVRQLDSFRTRINDKSKARQSKRMHDGKILIELMERRSSQLELNVKFKPFVNDSGFRLIFDKSFVSPLISAF